MMARRFYDEGERMVARLEYKLAHQHVEDLAEEFTGIERRLIDATGRLDDARSALAAMGEDAADV